MFSCDEPTINCDIGTSHEIGTRGCVDMPVPRAWISIGMSCVSCVVVWTAKRFLRDYTVSPTVTESEGVWARTEVASGRARWGAGWMEPGVAVGPQQHRAHTIR